MSDRLETEMENVDARNRDGRRTGFGWRRLQAAAAIAVVLSLLIPMALQGSVEPFILAFAGPFVVGLLLMLRWPRVAAVFLGAISVLVLAFSLPYMAEPLTHPEAIGDFVSTVVFTLATIVAAAAAVPAFRTGEKRQTASGAPRWIAVTATVVTVAATVVAIVASISVESVSARPGDVRIVTEDLVFEPAAISVEGDDISVHVTNRDATRHTFTIDELGVDLNVPPDTTQRVSFSAEPGTYRFYCTPHAPDMEGTLVVG